MVGVSPQESEDLLRRVCAYGEEDHGQMYTHKWQPGDMVLWVSDKPCHTMLMQHQRKGRMIPCIEGLG